jgi:chromosome segregation ATPase
MSTAGKVLTVLVALATIGWIVLVSMVSSLDTSYGKKLDAMTSQIEKLDQQIADTVRTANQTLVDVTLLQEKTDREMEVLHATISHHEKQESELSQALTEVALRIQMVQQSAKDAAAAHETRVAEKKAVEAELVAVRDEVRKRYEVVQDLAEQVKGLQADFIATEDSNRSLLEQLKGRSGTPTAGSGRVRPASFVR